MKKTALFGTLLFLSPLFAFAQTLGGIITTAQQVFNNLIPVIIAAAVVVFFWGLLQYILKSGGEGGGDGKKIMIAGGVALFVMFSVWGLIKLAQDTLGISGDNNTSGLTPPQINP